MTILHWVFQVNNVLKMKISRSNFHCMTVSSLYCPSLIRTKAELATKPIFHVAILYLGLFTRISTCRELSFSFDLKGGKAFTIVISKFITQLRPFVSIIVLYDIQNHVYPCTSHEIQLLKVLVPINPVNVMSSRELALIIEPT